MWRILGFAVLRITDRPKFKSLPATIVVAYTRNTKTLDACLVCGAPHAASNREVGDRAEDIFTMLPDEPKVESVVLGQEWNLEGCKRAALIVDMISINPPVSQKIAKERAAKGADLFDAPVSGGGPKAVVMLGESPRAVGERG